MTVDFWDLGRLLGRRWRVAVPLVLLAIVMTAFVYTKIKPDFVASANVSMVPPTPVAVAPGQPQPVQRNPWLSQPLTNLANAALISVQDAGFAQSLVNEGLSDSYTVAINAGAPLVTFQVTGKSAAQATGTIQQLLTRFDQTVRTLQTSSGVDNVDLITSRHLDNGQNVTETSSNVKRAAAAVGAAGLLIALAATIGIDTFLRRRKRRELAATGAAVMPPVAMAPPPVDVPEATATPPGKAKAKVPPAATTLTMTRILSTIGSRESARANAERDTQALEPAKPDPRNYDVPADATIVLPKATPSLND
jgi:capsular polysaccharide biosynthesis protein